MSLVDLGKRLLEAAKQGCMEEVRTLMSNGAPFTTDWLGTSPLHFAALNGHVSTAEVLLRAGISRDARTKVDRTPLHVAAQEGHVQIVDLLIRNGADIEAKDMLKMTPLHWAVEKGHIPVIELLMASGADTNCQNKFEKNSIDIAYGNGRSDIAEVLQLARATVDATNSVVVEEQQTVLEEVTEVSEVQPEITIQEEVDDGLIDHQPLETAKGAYYLTSDGGTASVIEEEGGEQNSTAVLATLAALAEATAPRTAAPATSDAETLKWLEAQGITMISADNSTLVASTLDNGQQLALTEAGKLALKQMAQQKEEEGLSEEGLATLEQQQGVMTIMTADGQLVEAQSADGHVEGSPLVVTLQPDGTLLQHDPAVGEPALKRIKTEDGTDLIISAENLEPQLLHQQLEESQVEAVTYHEHEEEVELEQHIQLKAEPE